MPNANAKFNIDPGLSYTDAETESWVQESRRDLALVNDRKEPNLVVSPAKNQRYSQDVEVEQRKYSIFALLDDDEPKIDKKPC